MINGLNKESEDKIIQVLTQYPAVQQAILYGSRSKKTHRNGSDIDLALLGPALTFPMLLHIAHKLDNLLLPYAIDLCLYPTSKNSALRQEIEQFGCVIYNK